MPAGYDVQDLVALAITAGAALYLLRRLAGTFAPRKGGGACGGGCQSCGSGGAKAPAVGDVVQIGAKPPRA
jgi:hypothetical protein